MSEAAKRDYSRIGLGLALKLSHVKGMFGFSLWPERQHQMCASRIPWLAECDDAHMGELHRNVNAFLSLGG
jgi:hypothetical protein